MSSRSSRYEISHREREDEARRHFYEFDEPSETYHEYIARLSERPEAGDRSSGAAQPGTGRSENRDKEAA